MSKYYHGTSYSNLLKIIEEGKIKTSMEGIIYLAKTKEEAFRFVALRYMTEDIAVIELDLDDSKVIETFDKYIEKRKDIIYLNNDNAWEKFYNEKNK